MTTPSSDNPFGPLLGSILPYLSQASQQGALFDFPMPGITHANGAMASGGMGGSMTNQLGLSHDSVAASGMTSSHPAASDTVIAGNVSGGGLSVEDILAMLSDQKTR